MPFPDELPATEHFTEGEATRVVVNRYERDPQARALAIAHYGCQCMACSFDFEKTYGPLGHGFVHVHHLAPLAELQGEYTVDPVKDLRPVCPNCHAMLHRRSPPFTIEELQHYLKQARHA
ncbi:HNH endonuclease [Aeoliella sp. ICT_H6.2]|uniref:HNH endonuclease n=1 Tax=Aeoliella straminimaris TaxID=2954799 RepID=A0A9X2FB34_9BACT|nr:HNH endonuclease [Aeoliella straminimaris]MCO6042756.1 HNH endonuclease [Aeoliella straminimaris]